MMVSSTKTHKASKSLALVGLLAALAACTASRPPNAYMPDRSGLQPGETITVKGNENIYVIAQKNNVSMREVIVLNDLKPPYTIRPGQRLVLPANGSSFAGDLAAPSPSPLAPVEKTALSPITPPAVSSQALEPVASSPAAPASESKSGIQASSLPAAQPITPSPAPVPAPASAPEAKAPQTDVVQALNSPAPAPKVAETTAPAASAAPSSLSMKWPIQGPILSNFGSKKGVNNDGINIGAPKGAPVVAAASGIVVYAGNEMKGFGNLVLVRHEGDLVTAYSQLDRVLVKKDSVVAQGDMIGTVGKTGNVASPQLHFEVRLDGKAVDPAKYIKGSL